MLRSAFVLSSLILLFPLFANAETQEEYCGSRYAVEGGEAAYAQCMSQNVQIVTPQGGGQQTPAIVVQPQGGGNPGMTAEQQRAAADQRKKVADDEKSAREKKQVTENFVRSCKNYVGATDCEKEVRACADRNSDIHIRYQADCQRGVVDDSKRHQETYEVSDKSCDAKIKLTRDACNNPMSDLTGIDKGTQTSVALMASVLGQVAPVLVAGDPEKMCNWYKMGGAAGVGTNGGFAARCQTFISECEDSCDPKTKPTEEAPYFARKVEVCQSYRGKVAELASQASVSAYGAAMGQLCAAAVASNNKPFKPTNFENPGGSLVNCNSPSNATNPVCLPIQPGNLGSPGSTFSGPGSGITEKDTFALDPSLGRDAQQLGVTGGGASEAGKTNGVPNGGGNMAASNPLGGGGPEGKGGAGGGGHNTDVLQGERGGSGYSVGAGGGFNSGSGFSGYGSEAPAKSGSGFDLAKYLPGAGGADANKNIRGPAGLGRAPADVGPMHEDIFKKISDRVRMICLHNRLECN